MFSPALLTLLLALGASPELERAERAFEEGRFDDVLQAVQRSLLKPLSAPERLRAHHLQAMTHAAFDDGPKTIDAFRRALAVDPGYTPGDEASPKIVASFAEAKRLGPLGVVAPPAPLPAPPPASAAADERPLYQRGWFWGVVIGVVAAGAAASITAAAWPKSPRGNLGAADLP